MMRLASVVLACLVASCAPTTQRQPTATPDVSGEVVVFAASSLTDAFKDLGQAFSAANPGVHVIFNFGASSQLATQLGQGARADVFASADQAQMDNARSADALAGPDRVFATNRLVLVVPHANPREVNSVKDLAQPGLKLVTANSSVPIGQYTIQMLDKAAADGAYGSDFKERVLGNVVSREDNVRQVLSKVQLGEADAAVVYTTDVTPQVRDQVRQIEIPDALQAIVRYPIATAKGTNSAAGEAFANFVLSPAGQDILSRWGFERAPAKH